MKKQKKKQKEKKRNTLTRLLKNKKGIFSGIIEAITSAVSFIKDTLPKPVMFLLFLLIILILGNLFTYVFNIFGIFCNSADQPVKLTSNPLTSISLINDIPDPDQIGLEGIRIEETPITTLSEQVTECSTQIQTGKKINSEGLQTNISNPTYFYDGVFCTTCEPVTLYNSLGDRVGGIGKKWCDQNAFPKEIEDKTFLQKTLCGNIACEPPKDYYYEQTSNIYRCNETTCAGKTIADEWNDKLEKHGATLLYKEIGGQNKDYTQLVGATCRDIRPRLSVFGIEVFNYKYWVFLLIIIMLLWGMKKASEL